MAQPEMHITIVAAGDHSHALSLAHEIELVKAALLYADRVTLASPRAAMIGMVGAVSGLSGHDRTEALWAMAAGLPRGQSFRGIYEALKAKRYKTREELLVFKQMDRVLTEAEEELSARTDELAINAGLGEILSAAEEGVLEFNFLGIDEGDSHVMVERMTQLIGDIVAPASTTLPMFDDSSTGFLRAMLNEGIIPEARLAPATQVGVAARLIGWVPAFPDADVEAILDARNALRDPLIRYRSAIVRITRDLEAAPIDAEFESVVQELHRQYVEPALLEIEDLGRQLGLATTLGSALQAGAGGFVTKAIVTFAAAQAAGLPSLLLTTGGLAADIAAKVVRDRRDVTDQQRENQFYFLYEADRTLTQS
jgi:hypothetical protein